MSTRQLNGGEREGHKIRASSKLPKSLMQFYPKLAYQAFGSRGENLSQVGIGLV